MTICSAAFRLAIIAALATVPEIAQAASVQISVRGPDGQPLADAVVTVDAPGAPRAMPHGAYIMEQKAIAFAPHVLVVPVGASVSLPNRDPVRHHVYSFSKAKKFDLKLYGKEDQRSIVFDKPGVVALGCNIHDAMSGFIYVTSVPFADKTNGQGQVSFGDVPAGKATLSIWSPTIRAPNNMLSQTIIIPAGGFATTITVQR